MNELIITAIGYFVFGLMIGITINQVKPSAKISYFVDPFSRQIIEARGTKPITTIEWDLDSKTDAEAPSDSETSTSDVSD